MISENWADELRNDKVVEFYYESIKDWYTPKDQNKLLPNKKAESFYLIKEPYEYDE